MIWRVVCAHAFTFERNGDLLCASMLSLSWPPVSIGFHREMLTLVGDVAVSHTVFLF